MAAITIRPAGTRLPAFGWAARPATGTASGRLPRSVYRRRRIAVAALFLGVLLAGSWVLSALGGGPLTASGADSPTQAPGARVIVVQPVSRTTYVVTAGDTLWSIARRLEPEGDVRPIVDRLAASRHGRPLQVGERIVLPANVELER
jgi:hypothetical protein